MEALEGKAPSEGEKHEESEAAAAPDAAQEE